MSPLNLIKLLDFYMEQVTEETCGSVLEKLQDPSMGFLIEEEYLTAEGEFTKKGIDKVKKVLK